MPVLTAQLKAAGTAFETIIGIPYLTTILVFGVIVIIYTLVGISALWCLALLFRDWDDEPVVANSH